MADRLRQALRLARRLCGWLWRRRDTIAALVAVAALCWALQASYRASHQARSTARTVAQVTIDQAVDQCRADNRTRATVAHALGRILDDVDAVTDAPGTERIIADLRRYITTQLGPRVCAVPARIDGVHGP